MKRFIFHVPICLLPIIRHSFHHPYPTITHTPSRERCSHMASLPLAAWYNHILMDCFFYLYCINKYIHTLWAWCTCGRSSLLMRWMFALPWFPPFESPTLMFENICVCYHLCILPFYITVFKTSTILFVFVFVYFIIPISMPRPIPAGIDSHLWSSRSTCQRSTMTSRLAAVAELMTSPINGFAWLI